MKNILILPALLIGVYANAKAWTFTYPEEGKWIEQTETIDRDGWPRILSSRVFAEKPARRKGNAPLFSKQKIELKNANGISLWEVTQDWDWHWELKFTDWVKSEIDASWWKKNGIATDCADAIISARWIFARNNGLPMANHLGSGAWFTQRSVKAEWEALPTDADWTKDQRFLAGLNYLLAHTFTHSLWKDSYPVAVSTLGILPGGYHLSLHGTSGHTQFVFTVGLRADQMPLTTLNSTVPREVRDLVEYLFLDGPSEEAGRAFLRMRWPIWTGEQVDLVPASEMPQFSLEQFAPDFIHSPRSNFWEEVYYRLDPLLDYDRVALRVSRQIFDQFKARVPVVESGYRICSVTPCAPGSAEYEAWSTPSRDARTWNVIQNFDLLMAYVTSFGEIRDVLHSVVLTLNHHDLTMSELLDVWRASGYTSDPNDAVARRWGQ